MSGPNTPFTPELPAGYRALHRLGSGAFGEVWRAEAPGGVEVAVKLIPRTLKPEEAERELEALQLIKRLRHPYLLSLQAFFSLKDRLVIVLELADRSLHDRFNECRAAGQAGIPAAELVGYVREAAEALDYLHANNIQHRDIKSDNLLLFDRHAKVADCGVARLLERHSLHDASTVGTPTCMPPEVWKGQVTVHSDQYSLAVTYAELRLGRLPFPAATIPQLMHHHLHKPPQLDPLDEAEQRVLLQALAKDPEQRFPSCTAFARALAKALAAGTRAVPGKAAARSETDFSTAADASLRPPRDGGASPERTLDSVLGTLTDLDEPAPPRGSDTAPVAASLSSTARQTPASGPRAWRGQERPAPRRRLAAVLITCLLAAGIGLLVWQLLPLFQADDEQGGKRPASVVVNPPVQPKPPVDGTEKLPKKDGTEKPPDPPVKATLSLSAAGALTVEPGGAAVLEVTVRRANCNGPVRLTLAGLPAGVRGQPVTLAADQDTARIDLKATGKAAETEREVTLRADLGAVSSLRTVRLTVAAPPSLRLLPLADVTAQTGQIRSFAVRVARRRTAGPVELRLENLPPGVTASRGSIAADRDNGGMAVTVGKTAQQASRRVRVVAACGGRQALGEFLLTVGPPVSRERRLIDDGAAIDRAPKDPIAWQNRGHTHREFGEHDKAIADYSEAIRLDPLYGAGFNSRGNAYNDKKEYDKALADYDEFLRLDPGSAVARNNRGNVYRHRKEYSKAIAEYDEAIRLEPSYVVPWLNRAVAHFEQKEYDKALEDYSAAIRVDPGNAPAHASRGNVHRVKGEYDKALADCTVAIRLDPRLPYPQNIRGLTRAALKEHRKAIDDFSAALAIDPGYAAALGNRAGAYYALGDHDRAIDDFREAARLDGGFRRSPSYALAHYHRGQARYRRGDRDGALDDFDEALRLNPRNAPAHVDRGNLFYDRKDHDRAIEDYSAALKISPKYGVAYNNRGNARFAKRDFDGAIADYDSAVRVSPKYALAYNNRGNAYRSKNDWERAVRDYTEAINLSPNYQAAYHARGNVYLNQGENDKALADFNEAIRLNGKDALSYNDRGVAYARKKEYKRAIADYSEAIRLKKDYALAYANRARAHAMQGDLLRARADRAQAVRLDPAWAKILPSYDGKAPSKKAPG